MKTKIVLIFIYVMLIALAETSICSAINSDTLVVKDESVFHASDDSVCAVAITYPILSGLNDVKIQEKTNTFLKIEFLDSPEWLSIEDCDQETGFTYESDYNIRYNSKTFVSIQQYVYEYSGGAHGNYAHYSFNIDLSNGEIITLADIINAEQFSLLTDEAVTIFLEDKNASSLIDAGLFENTLTIQPEQDFYILPGVLVLQFDPYEIASYSIGEIEIKIPFQKIKDLLKPNLPFSTDK